MPEPHLPDLDAPPVPFEGDFFGQYGADDFLEQDGPASAPEPVPSSSSAHNEDDEDDDEDDEDLPQAYTGGWEPPVSHLASVPSTCPPPMYDSPAGPRLPSAAEREAAQRSTHAKTFVVQFPGNAAGTSVPDTELTSSTYHQYQHDLHAADSNNIYAPFTSKMDWEVARWAKLRGPGSTSFNELATIEGVRLLCYLPNAILILFNTLLAHSSSWLIVSSHARPQQHRRQASSWPSFV